MPARQFETESSTTRVRLGTLVNDYRYFTIDNSGGMTPTLSTDNIHAVQFSNTYQPNHACASTDDVVFIYPDTHLQIRGYGARIKEASKSIAQLEKEADWIL